MNGSNKDVKGEIFSTTIGVTIVFAIICVMAVILYKAQYEAEKLSLQHTIERCYSNLLLAAQEGNDAVLHAMNDEGAIGFGYYSVDGSPIAVWGEVHHERLPITFFSDTNVPHFKHSNVVGYNEHSGVIECIKYFSPGYTDEDMERRPFDELISDKTSYIVYLSFDGIDYISAVRLLNRFLISSIIISTILYLVILSIIIQNIKYREKLRSLESLAALGQASRTFTHELKNPLSAMTLQLALMKRSAREDQIKDLQVLSDETYRLVELSNKVAEFLRNPVGNPEVLDLVSTVRNIASVYGDGLAFDDGGLTTAYIKFDEDRLFSVIENLISNAADASKGNLKDIELALSSSNRGKNYMLHVKDRGCGIDDETLSKAFQPFFTTKYGGSGIGLSISKSFVEALGGSISLAPREGGGAVATVVFKKCREGVQHENSYLRR